MNLSSNYVWNVFNFQPWSIMARHYKCRIVVMRDDRYCSQDIPHELAIYMTWELMKLIIEGMLYDIDVYF